MKVLTIPAHQCLKCFTVFDSAYDSETEQVHFVHDFTSPEGRNCSEKHIHFTRPLCHFIVEI